MKPLQQPAARAKASSPAAAPIVHGVNRDSEITPAALRVYPWNVTVGGEELITENRAGIFFQVEQSSSRLGEDPPTTIFVTGFVVPDNPRLHSGLELSGGLADIDELETFARTMLAVIAEARRAHPELNRAGRGGQS